MPTECGGDFTAERPISSNRFIVLIGPAKMSFSKVKNIYTEVEVEAIKEGGVNDHVHIWRKPASNIQKLVFERGVCPSNILSSISSFAPGTNLLLPGTILVLNSRGIPMSMFVFTSGIVLKWKVSDLDAKSSEVFIETFEVAHTGIKQIPIGMAGNAVDLAISGDLSGIANIGI